MTVVIFDLDGTISDPALGVTNSINYALSKIDESPREPESLFKYIGPPLEESFRELLPLADESDLRLAIKFYRERYIESGYRENMLYKGIEDVLQELSDQDFTIYIATLKLQDIAEAVIEHFQLQNHFKAIYGCGVIAQKSEMLQEIASREKADEQLIMVGDRASDMKAGHCVSATCIGVLWGFASEGELTSSNASILVDSATELLASIQEVSFEFT